MRERTLKKLLGNEPSPLVWALVMLPSPYAAKKLGWRRVEDMHNGAIFLHEERRLVMRCHGVQTVSGDRWWHAALVVDTGSLTVSDIDSAIRLAFPPNAVVLQAFAPSALRDEEEPGTAHLWWSVDGKAGLPSIHEWDADYLDLEGQEPAPVHD